MKTRRQMAIIELIDQGAIVSQEQLRRRLRARGIEATQATLSRDIKELGLVKRSSDGAYQRAGEAPAGPQATLAALERAAVEYLRGADHVQQIVVLRTGAGQAQPLALAIDHAQLPGVVGTLGGDDTIIIIVRDARQAAALVTRLKGLAQST